MQSPIFATIHKQPQPQPMCPKSKFLPDLKIQTRRAKKNLAATWLLLAFFQEPRNTRASPPTRLHPRRSMDLTQPSFLSGSVLVLGGVPKATSVKGSCRYKRWTTTRGTPGIKSQLMRPQPATTNVGGPMARHTKPSPHPHHPGRRRSDTCDWGRMAGNGRWWKGQFCCPSATAHCHNHHPGGQRRWARERRASARPRSHARLTFLPKTCTLWRGPLAGMAPGRGREENERAARTRPRGTRGRSRARAAAAQRRTYRQREQPRKEERGFQGRSSRGRLGRKAWRHFRQHDATRFPVEGCYVFLSRRGAGWAWVCAAACVSPERRTCWCRSVTCAVAGLKGPKMPLSFRNSKAQYAAS